MGVGDELRGLRICLDEKKYTTYYKIKWKNYSNKERIIGPNESQINKLRLMLYVHPSIKILHLHDENKYTVFI